MNLKIETDKKYETVKDFQEYLDQMENNASTIKFLDLSDNTYTPEVAKEIAKKIKKMNKLKKIRMESIMDTLNREEMVEVGTLLFDAFPITLEELEMPSNALSCNYPEAIGTFLSKCQLKVINFFDCGLGEDGLIRMVGHLKKLKNKENLLALNLGKNRINRLDASFTDLFNEFVNLVDFRIKSNTIEEESLAYFLSNANCKNLMILDLSDNFVCEDCYVALGELFKRAKLQELYLYDAKMEEGGLYEFLTIALGKEVEELPGGIEKEKPILTLDISCLYFEQECVELLEKMAEIYNFRKLIIYENDYEDVDNLIKLVTDSGGIVVTEEEQINEELAINQCLAERINKIL